MVLDLHVELLEVFLLVHESLVLLWHGIAVRASNLDWSLLHKLLLVVHWHGVVIGTGLSDFELDEYTANISGLLLPLLVHGIDLDPLVFHKVVVPCLLCL